MKREAQIKELLISNAIHLVAEGGFEKATTKNLAYAGGELDGFKMNEVYIYRLFGSKEALYEAAFLFLENELVEALMKGLAAFRGLELKDFRDVMYQFFLMAWKFILRNEERCRCYVRFYYSVYFKGSVRENHNRLFGVIISELSSAFKEEADVGAILHSVFTSLFDFGIRVYNGDLEDSEINRPHVFNVLYCIMSSYLKESLFPLSVTGDN